ncbi:SDR family oxidoreductase [Paramicrobacterium fandaimingii]|uniref:SDR family oxidoreductase n=1 Tax=Paramicrobacterium fandaimingii TaxID=2708079 RepID=UPI0014214CA3|nr:SDR family oxidoreductase [Microbacterium fandaimingii]
MSQLSFSDLSTHRVLVPGGTGAVGEGVVRALLTSGAEVIVPTRSQERAEEFRRVLGNAADEHLHLVKHDYTTFAGAQELVEQVIHYRGGIDSVVAPIGGWWQGSTLTGITEDDWANAFTDLATTHMAMLRAALPALDGRGAYIVVVGDSAAWPVPGSGLVSMEQAALLMMQRVAAAENGASRRIFSLVLGPATTRHATGTIDALDVGRVAAAISASSAPSQSIGLHGGDDVDAALHALSEAVGA